MVFRLKFACILVEGLAKLLKKIFNLLKLRLSWCQFLHMTGQTFHVHGFMHLFSLLYFIMNIMEISIF